MHRPAEPQQQAPEERTPGEVEGPPRLRRGEPPRLALPLPLRQAGEVDHGERHAWRRRDDLHRPAPRTAKWCGATRAGATISASAALQSRGVERHREPGRRRNVVGELPGSSWSRNQSRSWAKERRAAASRPGGSGRSGGAGDAPLRASGRPRAPLAQGRPPSGASKSVAQRQLHAEQPRAPARPPAVASREWPPRSKKLSCDAHPVAAPGPRPRSPARTPRPASRGGAASSLPALRRAPRRGGSAGRSTLPLGVSGRPPAPRRPPAP